MGVGIWAIVGGGAVLATGGLAGALVPWAMSSFGTVVAGTGTIHAAAATGGVAALFQSTAATLLSAKAVAVGATLGGAAGATGRRVAK